MTRYALQGAMRAAAVDLVTDYADGASLSLQVYAGRPRSIHPPTAFVDQLRETVDYSGLLVQRHPVVDVVVLHGLYDSKDTASQRDAFVDGFLDYCIDQIHAAGANTTLGLVEVQDEPTFVPDWLPPQEQKTYYATRLSLEGLALSG